MKKVLFFIDTLGHGGAEKVLVNLVNRLDRKKYDVTLMTIFDQGVNRQYLSEQVHYRYIFKKVFRGNVLFFKLFSPKYLYKHYIKERYDVVVSYLEGNTTRILSACPCDDTKKLAWIHGAMTEKVRFYPYRTKKECIECYKKYDRIVGVSEDVLKSFTAQTCEWNNLEVVYNTVDTDYIKKMADEPLEDVKFGNEFINIVSVGRLIEEKAFQRLILCTKELLACGKKVRLYIIGEGEQKKMLESVIKNNSLDDAVFLTGFRDNPWKYVKKADLFVCSSLTEGFSTAVSEALILGVPVVTTRCSGMAEMLGNNEYGIITENTQEALLAGIKYMLSDKSILTDYKQKSEIRGKKFDSTQTVAMAEELL